MNEETYHCLGVFGTSTKEAERRIPLLPADLGRLPLALRTRVFLEDGYAADIAGEPVSGVAGYLGREELFARCDMLLLPKPTEADFPYFREGQVLWGWPHCVQGRDITQVAIDRRMTLIAWEQMYLWHGQHRGLHIFHKNNELAGYSAVNHALQLMGITGHYGQPRRAAVIGFGATGRGAIHALGGCGYTDITLYTQRPYYAVGAYIPSTRHRQYRKVPGGHEMEVVSPDGSSRTMTELLLEHDIIVNCVLQDTDDPQVFMTAEDARAFSRPTIIVDVSCDHGMGFEFARPTSFEEPILQVTPFLRYYAVDHTPSYYWRASSFEISAAILPFVPAVLGGRPAWEREPVIRHAIEILEGHIVNPKILSFQDREDAHPHRVRHDRDSYLHHSSLATSPSGSAG